jgi:thiol-disulfide isomerase/thioredoxin
MHMRSRILPVTAVSLLLTGLLASCGSDDGEDSRTYRELTQERDALVAELDETKAELDDVDDQLAVAEARRADAEALNVAAESITADLAAFLVLDVMNRVGMERGDAECVSDAFVADENVRQAYLLLLDSEQAEADQDAAAAAYDEVAAVLEDCGLELADPDEVESEAASVDLGEVLGEVEVAGAVLPQYVDNEPDAAVGIAAPVVSGADYDGAPVRIDAATDGPTMVIVLAHWCPYCNDEIPKLNQLRDEGRVPEGVNIVAVSSAVNPEAPNYPPDTWIDDVDWTFPVLADGVDSDAGVFIGSNAYGVAGVPFVTLIDSNGDVLARWSGGRDIETLATALETLAAS